MSSPSSTRTPTPAGCAKTAVAATGATSGKAATPGRRTTPRSVRRLRRLQTTAVVLLTFGALVMTALGVSLSAATNAAESPTQYQRLGDARVQALAVQQAANTWAPTPTDAVRTSVTDRLTTLATKLADASAVDADRDRIVPLTGALVQYSMTLQDALNARGEASAALLAQADTQLSKQLLTPLESASAVAADRVAAELNDSWLGWTIAAFVVVAGGLIWHPGAARPGLPPLPQPGRGAGPAGRGGVDGGAHPHPRRGDGCGVRLHRLGPRPGGRRHHRAAELQARADEIRRRPAQRRARPTSSAGRPPPRPPASRSRNSPARPPP